MAPPLILKREDRRLLCAALELWIRDNQEKRNAVAKEFGDQYVGRQSTNRKRAEALYCHFSPPVLEA
tara:strand:+ start:3052 stop:3252 length:201 start_codon:yes stop_codon:yes gene_type:complete